MSAGEKISALAQASALTGSETLPLVQSGVTKRTTAQAIANLAVTGGLNGLYDVTVDGTATGDGATDDYAAIVAALAAVAADGRALWFPPGQYRLATSLTLTQRVAIYGVAGNNVDSAGDMAAQSVLLFDQGTGLVLGTGSMGSHIEGIGVEQGATHEAGTTDGITVNERCTLQNVTVRHFGGDGVYFPAAAGSAGTECMLTNVSTLNCDHGINIQNGNQTIVGGKHTSSRSEAIYCTNVFGCTFVGVKLRDCNSGGVAWQMTGAVGDENGQGQHVAIGCSVSGGNGNIYLGLSSNWIGGNSSVGFTSSSYGWRHEYQYQSSPLTAKNAKGAVTISSSLGIDSSAQIAWQWQSGDDSNAYQVKYDETVDHWQCKYEGASFAAYELTHNANAMGAGWFRFPAGFLLGNSTNARKMLQDTAAPVAGTYLQGDIIWNRNPTAGGTLCWVCTADGTPGTWTALTLS